MPVDPGVETPPESVTTFPHVDTLRAVGALAVLTTHVGFWSASYGTNGTVGALLARLDVGVALFFTLSGFLLSRAWMTRAAVGRPAPGTGHYLWKRALRILPVYVVTATLALALVEANRGLGWGDRVATYLLASTLVDVSFPAGLTHMWSLAVELHFYLLLPLLMLIGVGRRLRTPRVVALLVVLTALSTWWHLHGAAWALGDSMVATPQWLVGYLDWFAVGIGLALATVLHEQGRGGRVVAALRSLAAQPGVCWLLAGSLLLVSTTPLAGPLVLDPPTDAEALTKNLLYAGIGGLVVLPAVLRDVPPVPTSFDRVLLHPVARHHGLTSYGLFCLHVPVLHLLTSTTAWDVFTVDFWPLWFATLAVSLVAAELAYRLVERPALRLKGRHPLARRRAGSAATASAPSTGTSAR
jgi:peptidoglycan/LPS O-acetylase OafA/YrhL